MSQPSKPVTTPELSEYGKKFMREEIERKTRTHDWDAGHDGWGVVFGVSRCKTCGEVATHKKLSTHCEGKRQ